MNAPYTVSWAYRDGNPHSDEFDTFGDAHHFYIRKAQEGCCVAMSADGCEHDGERWHDGLTEDERDQLLCGEES